MKRVSPDAGRWLIAWGERKDRRTSVVVASTMGFVSAIARQPQNVFVSVGRGVGAMLPTQSAIQPALCLASFNLAPSVSYLRPGSWHPSLHPFHTRISVPKQNVLNQACHLSSPTWLSKALRFYKQTCNLTTKLWKKKKYTSWNIIPL